jgi:hypothetical protein
MVRFIIFSALFSLFSLSVFARQEDSLKAHIHADSLLTIMPSDSSTHRGPYFSIGSNGIRLSTTRKDSIREHNAVTIHWGMVDVGINALDDQTDYGSEAARQYLQVPEDKKNGNLFSLRPAKSINVNIWPFLMKVKLMKHPRQKICFYTGIGLQLYNFRFNKDISYRNDTRPLVLEDSVDFSKNKLAFTYVSVPLMFNFKTRMSGDLWFTYGFGLIGGYCLDSWTKQISDERGKQKNHDAFNFQKFNLNLSAEIGISDYIRLYGTYQVSNLYQNSLRQYPFALGIRFCGI